jgi:HK97 family phage portal protein
VGWITGQRKTIGLQVPDGDQAVISLPPFGTGKPNLDGMLYPDSSYETFARNGYGRNELVYACISLKASHLPQSVLRVYPSGQGEPLEDHRLRRLLAQPNPVTDEFAFWELCVTYLDLAGNCYWLIQRARDGLPAELWPLRPDLVRVIPTMDPRVWHYGYVLDPTASARNQLTDVIPIVDSDIVHVKYPNPLDAYFGQPPLRPSARATSLDNSATDFVDALLRNHAIPGIVVTTAEATNDEVTKKLKAKWKQAFGGRNRGEPAFLQAGMDVKTLGLNLRDLEFPDLRAIAETRICMDLHVPAVLVGAKTGLDRSTFSNMTEARRSLWEDTLFGLQRKFAAPVRSRLLPEFAGVGRARVRVDWDNSKVPALREAETDRWDRATNALARGGITINDFRRTVELDPVEGGDVFLIPAGVALSPLGQQPQPQPTPQPLQAASYATEFLERLHAKNGDRHALVGGP